MSYCNFPRSNPSGIHVTGDYAYVAQWNGLRIVDISDPDRPRQRSLHRTPGSARGVYIVDGYAYVADHLKGLRVIDVSDPRNPYEVGCYDIPDTVSGVHAAGGYIYAAAGKAGLYICGLSSLL